MPDYILSESAELAKEAWGGYYYHPMHRKLQTSAQYGHRNV